MNKIERELLAKGGRLVKRQGYWEWILPRPVCGAKTRTGAPCRRRAVPGKTRCPNHGGLSTGPRTEKGKRKIAASNWRRMGQRRAAKLEQVRTETSVS